MDEPYVLTPEVKKALDKLYNLCSEDSVILKEIDEIQTDAERTVERTKSAEIDLKDKIVQLENRLDILRAQGEKWIEVLESINTEEIREVLIALDSNFNPENERDIYETRLPEIIAKLEMEIDDAKNNLKRVQKEMKDAERLIKEMHIRREDALENQDLLNRYVDRALSGDMTITREEVSKLLDQFVFVREEGVLHG